jgi:Zn-dependent M28 family amino/carboxypeptidase
MKITGKYLNAMGMLSLATLLSACITQESHLHPDVTVNPDNLYATVNQLVTVNPARSFNNHSSLENIAQYIKSKYSEYGLLATEQEYEVRGVSYKNIIASYGPTNSPVLVIGAHYDVFDELPGADDNASGVAGILELARLISILKPSLNYRIEFVVYTLEEPPFFRTEHMGSFIHAKSLHENNVEVIGMASLEMIGYFSDSGSSQEYPLSGMKLFYPTVGDFIAVVSNFSSSSLSRRFVNNLAATALNTEQLRAPSFITGVDFSDHMNYWNFGYDAVMITDTSFYRNANYHKMTDTLDTLNYTKMAEVVKGVYWTLINLQR